MPRKVENFPAQNNARSLVGQPPPQPLYHHPQLKFMCISLRAITANRRASRKKRKHSRSFLRANAHVKSR